jgi:hypothetical protein
MTNHVLERLHWPKDYSCEDSAKTVFSAGTTCGPTPKGRQRHEEPSAVKAEDFKGRINPTTDI